MSQYLYSGRYYPAAPVVEMLLGPPGKEPVVGPIEALVDTGADATIVPTSLCVNIE
jgi:hypothetical protein